MFIEAAKQAKESMFPIFMFTDLGNGQTTIGVGGTGFFINDDGYFATVCHIKDGLKKSSKFGYIGRLPDDVLQKPHDIEIIAENDDMDVLIGRVPIKTPNHVKLASDLPEVGKSACISGYPLPRISADPKGGIDVSGVRRYFQPTFVLDTRIKIKSGDPKVKTRTHKGFVLRDVGLFGMSGGPILAVDGTVLGMQASVTAPRESKNATGRTISVENAVAIQANLIKELAEQNSISVTTS